MKSWTIISLIKDGWKNIKINKLVSIIAILTAFISLTLLGVIYSIIKVTDDNITNLQKEIKIVAFLEEDINKSSLGKVEESIRNINGVNDVSYVSSQEGLDQYKESLESEDDKDMIRIIDEVVDEGKNPIPSSFEISTINVDVNEGIKEELLKIEGIYKVSDSNVVTSFLQVSSKYLRRFSLIVIGILVGASILLISNMIKVSVFTRKREIAIMKYIGATDNYIRLPFIIEGLIIGVLGAVISIITVSSLYSIAVLYINRMINDFIPGFSITSLGSILSFFIPTVIIIGCSIGMIGSNLSLKKYLKV